MRANALKSAVTEPVPSTDRNICPGLRIAMYVCAAMCSGIIYLRPIIVGALIDHFHYTPTQAGTVVSIETLGFGLATGAAAFVAARRNRRLLALCGASLMIVASLAPLSAHTYGQLLLERFIGGAGCGILSAVATAILAGAPNPDRVFGLMFATTHVVAALVVPGTARLAHSTGPEAPYGILAGLGVIALFVSMRIPREAPVRLGALARAPRSSLPTESFRLLTVSLIFWTGIDAVWAFVERVGVSHGYSANVIGNALGAGQITSLAGALIASAVALRFGRCLPICVSILTLIFGAGLIGYSPTLGGFVAGLLAFNFATLVFLTYLSGLMASRDPSGHLVVLGNVSLTLGLAIGPLIAGPLVSRLGFNSSLWLGAACHAAALALLLPVLLRNASKPQARSVS